MSKKKNEAEEYFVNITEDAEKDLKAIIRYIAKNNPQTAIKINEKIQNKIYSLDHFPFRGSYIPELLVFNIKDVRQLIEHPWRIIYKICDKTVDVIAIVDSRRDLHSLLINKFLSFDS